MRYLVVIPAVAAPLLGLPTFVAFVAAVAAAYVICSAIRAHR